MNKHEKLILESESFRENLARRLLQKLCKNDDNGCLEWVAKAVANGGYGALSTFRGESPIRAHRVAWILENGAIPDGLYVCHSCDNPKCCNVEHLFLGTPRENMLDKESKGRGAKPPVHWGESHHNAKLTYEQVCDIRASDKTLRELSEAYDTSENTIHRIRHYKTRVSA